MDLIIFTWGFTNYKFTKIYKVQICYILYKSEALIFKPELLLFLSQIFGLHLRAKVSIWTALAHEILFFCKSVSKIFNWITKSQPLHVIMVYQSIKELVLLLWLERTTFYWNVSAYKFNIMSIILLPCLPLACFCTTHFDTCSRLYITLKFVNNALTFAS